MRTERGLRSGAFRWFVCFIMLTCVAYETTAQVSSRYADALRRARYVLFSGDVNSDGHVDILAKARPTVFTIDLDDLVAPIVFFPSPTFALISNSAGAYSLTVNPSASIVNSSVWKANTHDFAFGDILGNGAGGMLIRSKTPGGTHFTIATSATNGTPVLVQKISSADLGIDLGASGTTVQLTDTNRDGRTDLVVRSEGVISAVFVATANGTFERPADGEASILAAWRAFCTALDAGEINSALNFISVGAVPKYTTAFENLGSAITTLTQYWTTVEAVDIQSTYATYLLTQTFNGKTRGYLITFVKEGNRWVLDEL